MNSAWFVLVTLSTVGYGDSTPATDAGHVIACVAIVAGVLFMSMPLAIVGNNFCVIWDDKERVIFIEKFKPNGAHARPQQRRKRLHARLGRAIEKSVATPQISPQGMFNAAAISQGDVVLLTGTTAIGVVLAV